MIHSYRLYTYTKPMGKTVGEKPANETVVSKNKTEKTQAVLDALNKDHHEFKILKK